MTKIKWHWIWGIGITVVFLGLLAHRLEFFREKLAAAPGPQTVQIIRSPESWMNIYQNRKKIGVIHRTFTELENGRFQTRESVVMQINTMGVVQALNLSTESELNPDMTFSSFHFEINSSLFRFAARGYAGHDKLIVFAGLPHAQKKTVLPLKDLPHISGNIYEAAFRGGLVKDQTRSFSIFDPSTLGFRSVKVTRVADEVIPIMGKRILTQKFCADFMGAKNCAWLAKDGEVLKESGMMGLSMEKVDAQKAREGVAAEGVADFTQIASIASNRILPEPSTLTQIVIKVDGIRNLPLLLSGGRQNFSSGILTITKEEMPDTALPGNGPPLFQQYLQPSPLVQSDAPEIQKQTAKIVSPKDSPQARLTKIVHWVYRNVEKKPVLSVPNALEVLKNKAGDCNEHAVLTAALLRAANVPVQMETGLVYLNGRFYYHAWNTAYVGRWVTADAVFDQVPADVTHIRLVRGEGSEQLDLLGVMGKITLEVLSFRHD
jgi:transglutaminase-like putative cysteine protease